MSLFSRFVGKMRQIGGRTKGRVPHIATYTRELPISLERMYENALDWEHLPHLHSSSFAALELVSAGPWGWRARVQNAAGAWSDLELRFSQELTKTA